MLGHSWIQLDFPLRPSPRLILSRSRGTLYKVQCRIGAPRTIALASSMITRYDFVPLGPAVHARPGKTLPLNCVFSMGLSSPFCLAGVVSVSLASLLAVNST